MAGGPSDYRTTDFDVAAYYNHLLYRRRNFNLCVIDPTRINGRWATITNTQLIDNNVYQNNGFRSVQDALNAYTGVLQGNGFPNFFFINGLPAIIPPRQAGVTVNSFVFISYYSGSGPIPRNTCNFIAGRNGVDNISFVNVVVNVFNNGLFISGVLEILGSTFATDSTSQIWRRNHIINTSTITSTTRIAFDMIGSGNGEIIIRNSIMQGIIFLNIPADALTGRITINLNAVQFRFAGLFINNAGARVQVISNFSTSSLGARLTNVALFSSNGGNTHYSSFVNGIVEDPTILKEFDKYLAYDHQAELFSNSSSTSSFIDIDKDYTVKNTDNNIMVLNESTNDIVLTLPSQPNHGIKYLISKLYAKNNVIITSDIPINVKRRLRIPRDIGSVTLVLNNNATRWYVMQTSQHLSQ